MRIFTYLALTTSTIHCLGLTNQSSPLCRAGRPGHQRLGVCKEARHCRGGHYQGFCHHPHSQDLGVCCFEEYKCGGVTGDAVSYFQNPEFPSAVMDGSLCSHIVKIASNVCSLRLDFINFSMSGGDCNKDWFSIIGANDGEDMTGTLCGQQSGHSMYVPVSGGQNVILAAAVQSIGRAMFNIQITMVECNNLQESLHRSPSCGVQSYNKRSRRQFYLDLNSFGQQVSRRDRKRIARNKKTKNSPNRLPSYWRKIQKSELQLGLAGRIKKASSSQHPWVVKIMAASRLLCVGTAISRHYVLTSASCLVSRWEEEDISRQMKYLQLMETDSFISLYRIVLHHQWRLGQDLALVQTVTPLHHFLCLGTGALQDGLGAVQVGFKVNSSEKQSQSLFHQNISIPTSLPASLCPGSNCRTHSPDLSKWMSGSPLETGPGSGSVSHMVGLVSNKDYQLCRPPPTLIRVDTEQCIKWIASVTSENIRVNDVL